MNPRMTRANPHLYSWNIHCKVYLSEEVVWTDRVAPADSEQLEGTLGRLDDVTTDSRKEPYLTQSCLVCCSVPVPVFGRQDEAPLL